MKRLLFALAGKDPDAIVVSFWSGDEERCARMTREIRELVPDREHWVCRIGSGAVDGCRTVSLDGTQTGELWIELRRILRRKRIGLAPVLFDGGSHPLRAAALALAPRKILAYNASLERHHLRASTGIASALFLRGVPLDRIFLRPSWFPFRRERTSDPGEFHVVEGRPPDGRRRSVTVVAPFFPYPLAHGGAVRMFHLLREAAAEFDIHLFAFARHPAVQEYGPLAEFCARVTAVAPPHYREPRWSTAAPPEAGEYESATMRRLVSECRADLVQVEYTQLARYPGDVLVEHDVTWDLYRQVCERRPGVAPWWDYARWRRFEARAIGRFRRVVARSEEDAALLGAPHVRVIGTGVDLERFRPEPEREGMRLLFVGSFNHFPNVEAFRFFAGEVWPRLPRAMSLTVVAGRDHRMYWRRFTGSAEAPACERIEVHDFVRDVRPLYAAANLVVVPTVVSAGTNLKVLEAMAMERAVVSTSRGCAGLGLEHGRSVWIADDAAAFAEGVARLAADADLRSRIARAARRIAEERYDWRALGQQQRALWRELIGG
ncbi:MAG: glycosyltransferase [Bryobacteraceae bacterium]